MRLDRRQFTQLAISLAALAAMPGAALGLGVKPRQRVIIDNDFSGDPDGLFQLAHHLASASTLIPFIVGSHIHVDDFLDSSNSQADNAVRRVAELMDRMRLDRRPIVVAGRNAALLPGAQAEDTPAVRKIIDEALRTDTDLPLIYAAGAGLTDLAEAVKFEPRIADKLKLIWIGGPEYPDLRPHVSAQKSREYNMTIDIAAAQILFNDSSIEIWQVPRNVYRTMMISHAELIAGLRSAGSLGDYLLKQLDRVIVAFKSNLGETYILGDSPLVTLTALQSSFEPDSASSGYLVRPTPRITNAGDYRMIAGSRPMRVYQSIDARLTFADMFAKFSQAAK